MLKVAAIPKDAPASAVYYIEGARDFNKSTEVEEIRKSFLAGRSVHRPRASSTSCSGRLRQPPPPWPAPAAAQAAAGGPEALRAGPLNARIHDGKIQFADTATINALGITCP